MDTFIQQADTSAESYRYQEDVNHACMNEQILVQLYDEQTT